MSKLTVPRSAVEDAELHREAISAALRIIKDGMCSQPYCGRKAIWRGRCDVHRRAA